MLDLNGMPKVIAGDSTFSTGSVGLFLGVAAGSGAAASHRADDFSAVVQ
jgi:hypothetical protein